MLTLEIIKENIESLKSTLQSNLKSKILSCFVEPEKGSNNRIFKVIIWYRDIMFDEGRHLSNMTGYIWAHGEAYSYSFLNHCVPLFRNWCYELVEKVRQNKRTYIYKQELLDKTTYMDKIDIYGCDSKY